MYEPPTQDGPGRPHGRAQDSSERPTRVLPSSRAERERARAEAGARPYGANTADDEAPTVAPLPWDGKEPRIEVRVSTSYGVSINFRDRTDEANTQEPTNYQKVVQLTQQTLNVLFNEGAHTQRYLRTLKNDSAWNAEIRLSRGYHKYTVSSADELVKAENVTLHPKAKAFFLREVAGAPGQSLGVRLEQYLTSDLIHDVIDYLGDKSGKPEAPINIAKMLKGRLEFLWRADTGQLDDHEVTHGIREHKIGARAPKIYGRLTRVENGVPVYQEKALLSALSPASTEFCLAPPGIHTREEFERYVTQHKAELQNQFVIYPVVYKNGSRSVIFAARHGQVEIYYTSDTYTQIAGERRWVHQEAVMYMPRKDGSVKLWYGKPGVSALHEVGEEANLKINRALFVKQDAESRTLCTRVTSERLDHETFQAILVSQGLAYDLKGRLVVPAGAAVTVNPDVEVTKTRYNWEATARARVKDAKIEAERKGNPQLAVDERYFDSDLD